MEIFFSEEKMKEKFIKKILLLCMISFAFSCTKKNENVTVRTVIDQAGNEVALPEKISRVVIASVWPLASLYCLMYGSNTLVGLDPAIVSAAENSMLIKIAPEISKIETGFSKNGMLNAEELIKLKPDVVLYVAGIQADYDVCKNAGIPAVAFSLKIKNFNAIETIYSWADLLSETMNQKIDISEYLAYGKKMQTLIAERLSKISENQKPRAMIIHQYEASSLLVPGSSTWGDWWLSASGAINVAFENKGTSQTSIEQIYAWNPEFIYLTNFSDAIPNDLYENKLQGHNWNEIVAVKKKRVYKFPLGIYRWYVTNTDSPLTLLYFAKHHHPDLFSDIDFEVELKKFYKKFYKLDLTDEDVKHIFEAKRDASRGI